MLLGRQFLRFFSILDYESVEHKFVNTKYQCWKYMEHVTFSVRRDSLNKATVAPFCADGRSHKERSLIYLRPGQVISALELERMDAAEREVEGMLESLQLLASLLSGLFSPSDWGILQPKLSDPGSHIFLLGCWRRWRFISFFIWCR